MNLFNSTCLISIPLFGIKVNERVIWDGSRKLTNFLYLLAVQKINKKWGRDFCLCEKSTTLILRKSVRLLASINAHDANLLSRTKKYEKVVIYWPLIRKEQSLK